MAIESNYDEILKIVKDYNERDDIFYKRALGAQRKTLFFKFWDKHFEWNDLVNDFTEINGHILDFGCGSGHSDILMAEKGHRVHGIDISKTGIAIAKYLRSLQPKKTRKNISFEIMEVGKDSPDRNYDSVWSSHTFEHIVDPSDIFIGLKKLTKPSAKMLISVPFKKNYDHPTHVHRWYSTDELDEFLSKYVKVLSVKVKNTVLRAVCELD